jgi:hypothetical protein
MGHISLLLYIADYGRLATIDTVRKAFIFMIRLLSLASRNCFMHDCGCFAACNRTYYGDVGKTYELELHRPREDRLPFVCHLTFQAGGDDLGDLVQVQ